MTDFNLFFDQYGLIFLFFLIALTDAGIPIPLPYDLVILFTGYRGLPLWQVVVAVVPGAVLGNSILYFLAHTFGYRFLEKYERFFRMTHKVHKKIEHWFSKFGAGVLVITRLIPGLRFAGSFICGLFRLPYKKAFLPAMILASSIWSVAYYYLGMVFGEGLSYLWRFGTSFKFLSFAPLAILILIVTTVVIRARN